MSYTITKSARKDILTELDEIFSHEVSKRVELGIYKFSINYCENKQLHQELADNIYTDKANNIIYDLLDENNIHAKKIIKDVEKEIINPVNLAKCDASVLNPTAWKFHQEKHERTRKLLSSTISVKWQPCKKCGLNDYDYYQIQLRSADEPMTTFYQCNNNQCKKKYKINN
jgi:DNA-directed RNA polymerase subunit M/transcription elongation factor TFIIS